MGRGRGKGRRQSARDDADSGEDERIPASKRRGRPQRLIKNEEDGDTEMMDDDDTENVKSSITDKDAVDQNTGEDGKKRRNSMADKEDSDMGEDEKGSGAKSSTMTGESVKSVGFRQIGSRRKGKPRRAAEVGVECS
ncbi:hypothetical protein Droror1_Dr00012720 [Drosera rotundifolia]